MRLFLAVFPSLEAQELAHAAGEAVRRGAEAAGVSARAVSWVKRENLHHTLRFIGEVGEDGARRIEEAAFEAAKAEPAFDAVLGAPGAFPSARRARVLWLGLAEGSGALVRLAAMLERALARRGFAPEGRPFAPHLTLGRVRESGDFSVALDGAASLAREPGARFPVRAIAVVTSTLSPAGSRYDIRAEAALA